MTDVIHGDIKPDNVLIFKNEHGDFISKLADLGFSTLSMQEDELILLPRSNPWDAPEWHHRGFRFSAAKKIDAYLFGALCLWLIFRHKFGETTTSSVSSRSGYTGFIYLKESWKEYPRHTLFEKLKYEDQLLELAICFINMEIVGNNDQKSKLESFFTSALTSKAERRSSDFARFITLLGRDR
jgi:serine/threonine protein kinase